MALRFDVAELSGLIARGQTSINLADLYARASAAAAAGDIAFARRLHAMAGELLDDAEAPRGGARVLPIKGRGK